MRRAGWLVGIALAWPGTAAGACMPPSIAIEATVAASDRRAFEAALHGAVAAVCAWWGPTFEGAWQVAIDGGRGPSMALVPAWRGERGHMLFRAGPVRQGNAAIVHEVVHVFAPNANRFLAEGLAVYAHDRLGGAPAHPNFGADLHRAAQAFAAADLAALDRAATPQRLATEALDEGSAYLVAGSFVRFLVETHGLDRFRRLYDLTPLVPGARDAGDPGRWQAVYGADLAQLTDAWRRRVTAP